MAVQVAGVEDRAKLGATVLAIGAEVSVELVEGFEFGVGGCGLVGVRSLVADADGVAVGSCLLHNRQQVRGKDDVGHVVHSHLHSGQYSFHDIKMGETDVTVNSIIGQLVCHDTPGSVVDQDINPIRTACDLIRCLLHLFPV